MLGQGGQKLVFATQHPADGEIVLKLIRPDQHNVATGLQILALNLVRSPRVSTILEEGSVWSRLPAVESNCRFSAGDASQGRNKGQSGLKDENRSLAQFA